MGFSLAAARQFFTNPATAPITIATLIALILFLGVKRSRYFGNAAPLAVALSLFPLITTQVISQPWFWALPFLFTFIAGIFADALETKHRKLFLGLTLAIMATQALFCVAALSTLTTIT